MNAGAAFPETRDTLVAALSSAADADRTRALDLIARAYHRPIVAALSLRWRLDRADAEDLAQEFFARAIEKEWFARYARERGRFRPFLRRCLDDFVHTNFRDGSRLKRGGGAAHVALDAAPESALAGENELDRRFDLEWTRSVLGIACERLRAECTGPREVAWRLFEHYDLTDAPDADRPTYAALARATGEPVTQVTNHLAWARRRMREHVLATLRSLTGDDAEYREEVRALLGSEAP